jgi:hypothetical protein
LKEAVRISVSEESPLHLDIKNVRVKAAA